MFKLVISDDEGKTTVVPLVREEVTIGREDGNTIRLTERNVSRQHAKLEKLNGSYTVSDLGSYNGVRVNGVKIDGKSKLKAGDQIGIGDYLIAFHMAVSDSMTDPGMAKGLGSEATDPLAVVTATQNTEIIKAPAAESRPARLVMLTPPAAGTEFLLSEAQMRIGRMEDAHVWVNHKSISREHAEIVQTGDMFRIQDLRSANGVRVNGREVKDVELRSGDVIELGQVRFRFVPAGEAFIFDPAESTGQTEVLGAEGRGSRAPLYALLALLSVGTVAAAALFMGKASGPEPTVTVATGEGAGAPKLVLSDAEAQGYVDRCRAAVEEKRFKEAVALVGPLLDERPSHTAGLECRRAAEVGLADMEHYGSGMLAMSSGDPRAAYEAFARLSDGSAFLSRPEIREAAKGYAAFHLREANARVRKDPEGAKQHAELVLHMREVTAEWQQAAEKVLARVSGTSVAAQAPDEEPVQRPESTASKPATRSARTTTATKPTATPEGTSASVTQQCLAEGGDVSACVIRKVGPNPRSPAELSELIEAYRSTRDTPNMLKYMRRFTELYPNHPKARSYSQILLRHEGS